MPGMLNHDKLIGKIANFCIHVSTLAFPHYLFLVQRFLLSALLVITLLSCGNKSGLGTWSLSRKPADSLWIPFEWTGDSLGGRWFEKTGMFLPVRAEGFPELLRMQLDLGADLTVLSGNTLNSLVERHPDADRRQKLKSSLVFWDKHQVYRDLSLQMGPVRATTEHCIILRNYGESLPANAGTAGHPVDLGSLSADLVQHRILVIDYPNRRLAILDALADSLQMHFTPISLDEKGRPILPLKLKTKNYRVLFDTGSSLFSLITTADRIAEFSGEAPVDTIPINSWGTMHNVVGRPLNAPFMLGGQSFGNALVYADSRPEARSQDYDAIAGNALFWDHLVVLDFKNRRFGMR